MKYNDQAQLDPSQLSGGGGRGNGGKIALGGGGGLVVIILALVFGLNPADLLGAGSDTDQAGGSSTAFAQCTKGSDVAKNRDCRFVAYTNSIQAYWAGAVPGYQKIKVDTFTGSINTACGNATSAVGPFYCSGDTTVYLDLGFFDQLTGELGAKGGDAAEAYVLAHEFGHHVQNQTGAMREAQSQAQTGPKSGSVRLELQADCYAGVWFKHASTDQNGPIAEVTRDDLDRALDAASAVGDDRIQKKMRGQVSPETFTHGTAAQRQKWLNQGFTSGDPTTCSTFGTNDLG